MKYIIKKLGSLDIINNQLQLIHHLHFGRMISSKEMQKGYVKALSSSFLAAVFMSK